MDKIIEKQEIIINEGIKLKLFNTEKYKDINIYFTFINHYSEKESLSLAIVKDLVGLVSKNYPTKKEMTRKKNLLYSASVDSFTNIIAYNRFITFHYNFIDPKFVPDITIGDYIDFVKETLFNTIFDEANVNEEIKLLKSYLLRKLDKPNDYAKNQIMKILSNYEERFNTFRIDKVDQLERISVNDVIDVYNKMLNESLIEITIIGSLDEKIVNEISKIEFKPRYCHLLSYDAINIPDLEMVEESKDVNQTILNVKYKLKDFRFFEGKKYHSLMVATSLLGVFPCSLLFQEIREKLSLCYTISATNDKYEGLIEISTLISKENIHETIEQINKQVERVASGDYPLEQLETTKLLFVNSLIQSMDEANSIFNYYSKSIYNNQPFENLIDGIKEVTKEDICEIFKDYSHLLTYVLKGENGEDSQ